MKATDLLVAANATYSDLLLYWPFCLIFGHRWHTTQHYKLLQSAHMECGRCGRSQLLKELPDDWDGSYRSREAGELEVILAATWIFSFAWLLFVFWLIA